ncbi:FAD/NAD(P)-binding domain-containing protein [Penicillium expansum]|nr:FAD/NAD(P)-binding domain-containing protein [Penicillium expansum]
MQRWVYKNGDPVLLADSAHPMLQYVVQGAATAVEDAAALKICLSFLSPSQNIRDLLGVYCNKTIDRLEAV